MRMLFAFFLLCCSLGCDRVPATPPPPQRRRTSAATQRRIVAHSPAIVEILFAIGAGDQLVGVSQYVTFPPAAAKLPKIGGLIVNLERVAELHPTHIFMQGRDPKLLSYARQRGVTLQPFVIESVADLIAATLELGRLTDCSAGANREAARIRHALDATRRKVGSSRFRALLVIGRSPGSLTGLMTNTSGFLVECLKACGGQNLFADLGGRYPRLSLEAVLDRDPDVIIEITGRKHDAQVSRRLVADWNRLGKLKAVRGKRVVVIEGEASLLPGPRITETMKAFQQALAVR